MMLSEEYNGIKIGSVWKHKGGNLYIVFAFSNVADNPKEKYPPTINYANLSNSAASMVVVDQTLIPENGPQFVRFWSGRADDWHRRMTEVELKDPLFATLIVGRMKGLIRILKGERL